MNPYLPTRVWVPAGWGRGLVGLAGIQACVVPKEYVSLMNVSDVQAQPGLAWLEQGSTKSKPEP